MTGNDTHPTDDAPHETDGGTVRGAGRGDQQRSYLDAEVNLLRPSTPYMRDHLKVIWTGFVGWLLFVFGPVTATRLAPEAMTTQLPVIGFPLHYFLVAVGGPGGALLLSFWYARKRDQLDEKYEVDHSTAAGEAESNGPGGAPATDGGERE